MIQYRCTVHGVEVWDRPERREREARLPRHPALTQCELLRMVTIQTGQVRGCMIEIVSGEPVLAQEEAQDIG